MGQRVIAKPSEMPNFAGFGKQEGIAKVEGARFIAIQHQKGEAQGGGLITPYFALQLDEVYVGSDLKPTDDSGAQQFDVIVCWGSKALQENGRETEPAKPVFRFWPANGTGPDDMSPEDVGCSDVDGNDKDKLVEIGSEGSMLVSNDGGAPQAKTDFGIFQNGLEKKGFKADILGRGYAKDYEGLVYEFKTSLKADVCKKLGINYTAPTTPRKDKKGNVLPDTCREITNILVRPYESKTAAPKAAGKAVAAKAGAAASAPPASTNGHGDQAAVDAAVKAAVAGLTAGTEYPSINKFGPALAVGPTGLLKSLGMKAGNDFVNQLKKKSEDELIAMGMEFGFTVEGGKITVNAD